jgi:hypothetical protein
MRVVVIGGRGHMGAAAVQALRVAGIEVASAGVSANNDVQIDLRGASTLSRLDGFDAIVNCSDSLIAAPDDLVRHVITRGGLLLESAAEPVTMRRLLDTRFADGPGTAVLGAGIFPGLSNLLAAREARAVGECHALELGIRWSPLSAGGGGMVGLVPHLLDVPTHKYVDGALVEGPPVEAGPRLPFAEGERATLHVAFCEPTMLRRFPNVAVYGSFAPDILMTSFRLTPLWLLRLSIVRAWLWLQFTVLRRFLLRSVHASVRIVARARNLAGEEAIVRCEAPDGIACGGTVIAAMVSRLRQRELPGGLHLCDALLDLSDLEIPDAKIVVEEPRTAARAP